MPADRPRRSARTRSVNATAIAAAITLCGATAIAQSPAVSLRDGRLVYAADERGDRIPDFSSCGYRGSDAPIPDVPVRAVVVAADGDDGARIQAALDFVGSLPRDDDGFRGAVMLGAGEFQVADRLVLRNSGVVLRGCGAGEGGTVLRATGIDRRTVVVVHGVNNAQIDAHRTVSVADSYVPVGATQLPVAQVGSLQVGDAVVVTRPSTAEWVKALGADVFGVGWRPGSRDVRWERRIAAIDGNALALDAPLTASLDPQFGGGAVAPLRWPGRIERIGVEDLQVVASPPPEGANPHDEERAWFGVSLENVRDAWVRRVTCRGLAGGAVLVLPTASRVSVADCLSADPVSENAGYRRHPFATLGQQTLFLRCVSENGRRDFTVGHCAAGPNAFVNCQSRGSLADSGPGESWATGVLYDNVRIDGAGLALENRWSSPVGAGWCAANCVLWQCQAATMRIFRPPTAQNWAIGVWSVFAGDGYFEGRSEFANPRSLFQAQLAERVGVEAARAVEPLPGSFDGATNPSLEQAAAYARAANKPAEQLDAVLRNNHAAATRRRQSQWREIANSQPMRRFDGATKTDAAPEAAAGSLAVVNGWLTIDGRVIAGGVHRPQWWNGSARPDEAAKWGPAITRFVPGREGTGLTDNLDDVVRWMGAERVAALEHHYGLWYDRRRDDHLMVRRGDGDCYPPFYELPFARTGRGLAWDGLSKYDLTRFNPWYWGRLAGFAAKCDANRVTLLHQHYFQHNILEAGAHWADSPWRPANNVNDTSLPEPPPYVGDKRIFIEPLFYDVTHPRRRELHRGYIRQCLAGLGEARNVIHLTSAEYSGPREFVEFWIDEIAAWQQETGRDVLVALSAPKDVQDAILGDSTRAKIVDVIDIRYWAYTADEELYAPAGGQHLAPRQHLRQTRLKPGGFDAVARAVSEYRRKFPDKAVTYFAEENCPSVHDGWAVLMGGGSVADVRLPEQLAAAIVKMTPQGRTDGGVWTLAASDGERLVYLPKSTEAARVLDETNGRAAVRWINVADGRAGAAMRVAAARAETPLSPCVAWIVPASN